MAEPIPRIPLDEKTWLLVLTGAGISAESGLPTYRGLGGLWEGRSFEQLASPEGFREDPQLVWRFYSQRRRQALDAQPNPGHHALVRAEERLGDRFLLATQNVDGLHARAGSRRMLEVHGNILRSRCSHCDRPPFEDSGFHEDEPPLCDACEARGRMGLLRPAVVWFGEMLDSRHFEQIEDFLARGRKGRLVFLAVGTSGIVFPASHFVEWARGRGGSTWLVNADPAANLSSFDRFVQGKSGEVLPALLA
jgi:NAD-dependent deacetylase